MHLFWDAVIAPLLDAAAAETVIEIGVDKGETTSLLLARAAESADGLVHAIDPAPAIGAESLEHPHGQRLRFHRQRSHDALAQIGPVDAVLLDGDHNWFTVSGELRLLAEAASAGGAPLPLVIAHDVRWPYGRRDMYYEPGSIPDEHRHEAALASPVLGSEELDPDGISAWLWNAKHEGGPRNGVLTAIEDFVAGHEAPCELAIVEGFHGLGVLADSARIEASPALRSEIERLRSVDFLREWSQTIEAARIDAEIRSWEASR